jgi:chemotaxis protein MotB
MRKHAFTTPLALSGLLLFSACVSQRKYDMLLADKVQLEAQKFECEDALEIAQNKLNEQNETLAGMREELSKTQAKLTESTQDLNAKSKAYNELEEYYNNLLTSSGKLNSDLAEQQKVLMAARAELEVSRKRNEELAANLEEREKRVQELERVLDEKEQAVAQLKKKVSDALLNFAENDLTVEVRNGKVYVSLAEQLLFKSGSISVDPKGVSALKQLAGVLKESKDINVLVEGHTDNVPISRSSNYMKDNWDLSVLRATSIVNILTSNGVEPSRITAAGRGEFVPVASNDTREDRARNRRTEIILTPKLDELFEILGTN